MSWIDRLWQAAENERNRQFQAQQASRDREENYYFGEQAANNADARTRALYHDLQSPAAMLAQYKEAGLSPSMMFGGGGAGGASPANGAQGSGPVGPTTNYGASYISPLEGAQVGLINAQKLKTLAETASIEGVNERGKAEIANIFADIATKGASKALTEAITTGQRLDNALKSETYDMSVSQIKSLAEKAANDAQKALWENKNAELDFTIADKTQMERIKQIQLTTREQFNRILNIATQGNLMEAQQNQINNAIDQQWEQIFAMQTNAAAYADYVEGQKKYWQDWISNFTQGLEVQKRGQNIQLGTSLINAGTAVIQSGMTMTGNYMLGQQNISNTTAYYNNRGQLQGYRKDVTTKSIK